jgi:hypothetical protein
MAAARHNLTMSAVDDDKQQEPRRAQKRKSDTSADDVKMASGDDDESESSYALHPLFMDGLPSDFASNPALAALASLLKDDCDDCNKDGGKKKSSEMCVTRERKKLRKVEPSERTDGSLDEESELTTDASDTKNETTVSEASLFVKMWKL